VYLVSDFEKIRQQYPQFRFIVTLSKPSPAWKGTVGRVTEHVVQEVQNLTGTDFYLCGNHNMINDIETQLADHNVPKPQVHKELLF
jgi:NAD(P)H-flavin reductase